MRTNGHFVGFYSKTSNDNDLSNAFRVWLTIIKEFGFRSVTFYDRADVEGMLGAPADLFEPQIQLYNDLLNKNGRTRETWTELNFFYWKPFLLLKVHERSDIANGDWIFYHDLNFFAYPDYLESNDQWLKYLNEQVGTELLLFNDDSTPIIVDVKKELIRDILGFSFYRSFWTPHIWAGALAFKKGPLAESFLGDWLQLTSDLFARGCEERTIQSKHFWWHSMDQACLTIIYLDKKWDDRKRRGLVKNVYLRQSRIIPPPKLTLERRVKIFTFFMLRLLVFIKSVLLKRF